MTARGTVIGLEGPMAVVRVPRSSACGESCVSCAGCAGRAIDVRALNSAGACSGDIVEIESSTGKTLLLSFATYLLPVMLFIFGWLAHPALGTALFAISVIGLVFISRRLKAAGGVGAEVVRVSVRR